MDWFKLQELVNNKPDEQVKQFVINIYSPGVVVQELASGRQKRM